MSQAAREALPALHRTAVPRHGGTRTCPTTSRKEKPKSTAGSWICSTPGQRLRAGHLPTSGYTADCAGPEVPCSPRNSPQAGTTEVTTQALTVIFQVGFVNIVRHFRLHDVQLQRQGRRGLPPGQHTPGQLPYNGNLSRRCLAELVGMKDLFPDLATEPDSQGSHCWRQPRALFPAGTLTSLAKARKLLLSWTLDMISVRSSYSSTSSFSSRKTPWRPSIKAICFWTTLHRGERFHKCPDPSQPQHKHTFPKQ